MRASKQLRLLQFVEALTAAAEAYHSLHADTKAQVDQKMPILGPNLRSISHGLAEGVCQALQAEYAREVKKSGRYRTWWGLGSVES